MTVYANHPGLVGKRVVGLHNERWGGIVEAIATYAAAEAGWASVTRHMFVLLVRADNGQMFEADAVEMRVVDAVLEPDSDGVPVEVPFA